MDQGLFVYTILVGLALLGGTIFTIASIQKVVSYRKPLYFMRIAIGLVSTALFWSGLSASLGWPSLPPDWTLYGLEAAFLLVALNLITTPLIDRYEAKKLTYFKSIVPQQEGYKFLSQDKHKDIDG